MSNECGPSRARGKEEFGAQLRYDALISLVAKWNRLASIEEAARALVTGVKFVLTLERWRFVLWEDDEAIVVQGSVLETYVERVPIGALAEIERVLLETGVPVLLEGAALDTRRGELPEWIRTGDLRSVYGAPSPGPRRRVEHLLLIGNAEGAPSALDVKFAALIGGLFADKVRQLRAEQLLTLAYRDLAEKDSRIHADLCEGRNFQQSLLTAPENVAGLEIATVFEPLDMVGGDVYDLALLPEGRLRIFLVDATGHGLQAALRTMVLLSEYNSLKYRAANPRQLLRALNKRLFEHRTPLELLSPAVCADVWPDGDGHTCIIANAGAPPTLMSGSMGAQLLERGHSMLLGMRSDLVVEEASAHLARGDRLLFATDGLYEQRSPGRKPLGYTRVLDALARGPSVPDCVAAVRATFDEHRSSARRDDDVTAIFVGVAGATGGATDREE